MTKKYKLTSMKRTKNQNKRLMTRMPMMSQKKAQRFKSKRPLTRRIRKATVEIKTVCLRITRTT